MFCEQSLLTFAHKRQLGMLASMRFRIFGKTSEISMGYGLLTCCSQIQPLQSVHCVQPVWLRGLRKGTFFHEFSYEILGVLIY